jgi:hypothetical protein
MAVSHQPFVQIYVDPLCQTVPALPNSPALQPTYYDPMGVSFIPTYAVSHQMHPPSMANNINSTLLNLSTPRKDRCNYSNPPSYPRHHTRRTILLHNLDPTTTPQELHAFLQRDVTVESCEVLHADSCFNNAQAPRYRASARVITRSADEARRAVALYNNAVFKGLRLRVKIDTSITPTAPYTIAPMHYTASQSGFAVCGTSQLQPTPPTSEGSSSDSDEFSHMHKDMQCEQVAMHPLSPKSKPIDRCGPLVVNGSGIGPTAAVAI